MKKMTDKQILEKLQKLNIVDNGGLYIGVNVDDLTWLLDTLRDKATPISYSDCSSPVAYCSNCSCGKKEALENVKK